MSDKNRDAEKLKRRIMGLEKTLQIVAGHSGRMEENLRHLFEVVSNTIPVSMVISLKTGEVLFSNEKAGEIFGYSKDDFYKINAEKLYKNPGDRRTFLKILEKQSEVKDFFVNMKKSDGSIFPASLFSRQIEFEGRDSVLTITYDLSELRQEEEKRLSLERQLRHTRKMEAVGTMAGGIAHDFNNILTIILGNSELALLMLPEDGKARKHIYEALKAVERAKTMIRQLLDFCSTREEKFKPFHISTLVNETAKMIQSISSRYTDIKIRIKSKSSIILGDPTQIHQVLMNLCTNAVYALKNQGGVIEILLDEIFFSSRDNIMIPGLKSGSYVRLTVRDNGPGIEKGIMERVFDPFFTTKAVGEGTGMGLAIVHGIIQRHGGIVHLESEPGKGAAFHCYIPLFEKTEEFKESVTVKNISIFGSERILLVDDEKDIADICNKNLENMGYDVTIRSDGFEALELFQEDPARFDIVITDETMPKISGRKMALEMLKIRPDIPIILITGGEITDKAAFETGIRSVIRKPFTRNEIAAVIREVINNQDADK